jgi:hypothetical protein
MEPRPYWLDEFQFVDDWVVPVRACVPGHHDALLVLSEGDFCSMGEGVDLGHHGVERVEADHSIDLVSVPVEYDDVPDLVTRARVIFFLFSSSITG